MNQPVLTRKYLYSVRIGREVHYVYDVSWEVKQPVYCMTCGKDPARGCKCYHDTYTRHQISVTQIKYHN